MNGSSISGELPSLLHMGKKYNLYCDTLPLDLLGFIVFYLHGTSMNIFVYYHLDHHELGRG